MKRQFRPVNLSSAGRKTLGIHKFLGVDLSTPKFLIDNGRAVDALNFVYRDNVLQKRHGTEEIFKVRPFRYLRKNFDGTIENKSTLSTTNFNGMWSFIAEDKQRHIIAHIGKLLYELKENEEPQPILAEQEKYADEGDIERVVLYEYEDFKSTAYVNDYKLWFLGGNKFVCIRFLNDKCICEPVEDSEIAYVPTTTISITYNDSRASGRHSLDNVNLLTMYRKNKLISGTYKKEILENTTPYYEYTLDSPLITKNGVKDMTNFHMTLEERGVIKE